MYEDCLLYTSVTRRIYELAGEEFNINSPAQLGSILFEKLGLTAGKKTKRGYSTSAETLERIMDEHETVSYTHLDVYKRQPLER